MDSLALPYIAAALCLLRGVGLTATTAVVLKDFGPLAGDTRRAFVMAWVSGSIGLLLIGVLVGTSTMLYPRSDAAATVYIASAIALVAGAVLMLFTTSRTEVTRLKFCPVMQTVSAVLLALAA